jgi:hypothetical protein
MFFEGLANIHPIQEWAWLLAFACTMILLAFLTARLYPWAKPIMVGIGVSCLIMISGVWLNIVVMAANGGRMPVRTDSHSTLQAIVIYTHDVQVPESPHTRLPWLGDIFDLNSAGDHLLNIGESCFRLCLFGGTPLLLVINAYRHRRHR